MNWELLSASLSPETMAALRSHVENADEQPDFAAAKSTIAERSVEEESEKRWRNAKNVEYKEQVV
jgi:hypothetical protein